MSSTMIHCSSNFKLQNDTLATMKTYSLILLIVCSIVFCTTGEAKTSNLNQVKFRRLPPSKFAAALGSSIIIECEAGGSPPPSIHWLKDGKRVQQSSELDDNQVDSDLVGGLGAQPVDDAERMALSATRSRLFLDCADYQDEASYTCVAENAYSRVSAHTRLSLIKPELGEPLDGGAAGPAAGELADAPEPPVAAVPQCLGQARGLQQQQLAGNSPVRIHMWTHNIAEIQQNSVLLLCRSNNRKLVSWTLPDDKLVTRERKDKYEILDSGDLLIKDLRWSDMGSYICTVSNEQGSDSISSFVYPAARKIVRTTND